MILRSTLVRWITFVLTFVLTVELSFGVSADEQQSGASFNPPQTPTMLALFDDVPSQSLAIENPEELSVVLRSLSDDERLRIKEPRADQGRLEVGILRPVPDEFAGNLAHQLRWYDHGSEMVAYVVLRSPEAVSSRAALRLNLPPSSQILTYGFNEDGIPIIVDRETDASLKRFGQLDYWTTVVPGERVGIEIRIPQETDLHDVHIEPINFSHEYLEITADDPINQLECTGHIEIACAVDDGDTTQATADSVVSIRYIDEQSAYVCSAALLSNTGNANPPPPYILTARHCVPNSTVASTVVTYWFYQHATCGGTTTDSRFRFTTGGAMLLAARSSEDMALLELHRAAPTSVSYSDWDATTSFTQSDEMLGIHHPDGGVKMYWDGTVKTTSVNVTVCTGGQNCFILRDAFEIDTSQGALEGGSSGGPAYWDGTNKIAGLMSASGHDCPNRRSFFGKFKNFFPLVKSWLDPDDHGNDPASATSIDVDSTTPGKIGEVGDIDYFKVVISQSGELTVYTSGTTNTRGELTDENSTLALDDDDSGSDTNFRITTDVTSNTYYIGVESGAATVGEYVLHVDFVVTPPPIVDDHGDDWSTATRLAVNGQESGSLEVTGDVDVFEILVGAAGTLKVYTEGNLNTKGRLHNRGNGVDVSDDDSGDQSNFEINADLSAGTYYVEVSGGPTVTGSYTVHTAFSPTPVVIEDDHGDEEANATAVATSSVTEGNLEESGDTDVFSFVVDSAGTLNLYTTGSTDTTGRLTSNDDTVDQTDDDSGTGSNFSITAEVSAGVYFGHVSGFRGATGEYNLHVQLDVPEEDDHGNTESTATAVATSSSTEGNLEVSGDTDVFSFDVDSAGTLNLYTTGSTDTTGRLTANDDAVDQTDDDSGTGSNFSITAEVSAGVYFGHVSGSGSETGQYNLHVQLDVPEEDDHGNTESDATWIDLGSITDGSLEVTGDSDVFRLEVETGGTLRVYTSGTTDTRGRLRMSDGSVDQTDDDGGNGSNFSIDEEVSAGVFYVHVSGTDGSTGAYQLHVEHIAAEDEDEEETVEPDDHGDDIASATPIEIDSSTSGSIGIAGDLDFFVFDLSDNGTVTVHTTGFMDTVGHLRDERYSVSKHDDDSGPLRNFKIVAELDSGTYYVRVKGYSSNTGSYELHLSFVPAPNPLTLSVSDFFIEEHDRSAITVRATSERIAKDEIVGELMASGSATLGVDFDLEPSRISIGAGEQETVAFLTPIRDWIREGDETVDIEIVVDDSEDDTDSASNVTVSILDDFDGEGDVVLPKTGFDLVPTIDLRGGQDSLHVFTSIENRGSLQSSGGDLLFHLFKHPDVAEGDEIETVEVPVNELAQGAVTSHTFEIAISQLDVSSTFFGNIEIKPAESDKEIDDGGNLIQFGFVLDGDGHLETRCSFSEADETPGSDPLTAAQWHIKNPNHTVLPGLTIARNSDMRMDDVVRRGLSGDGVTVSLLDTGVDVCHPEIEANVDAANSVNFRADSTEEHSWYRATTNDLYNPDATGDQGTSAAGIIAGIRDNGRGGRGIAPSVGIRVFNYLKEPVFENFSRAIKTENDTATAEIYNLGFTIPGKNSDFEPHLDLLSWATRNLREARGTIFVKAAGDGFDSCSGLLHEINSEIGCIGSNADPLNNSPFTLVVGAVNTHDERASYSSVGSNLWVVAPAGDKQSDEGLVSTDQLGANRGYGTVNSDELWDDDQDYTSVFFGTAGAVASVSGAIAILLEVNSDLTFRDVKHILAKSARTPHSDPPRIRVAIADSPYVLFDGWTTNGAMYRYHNAFGFGAVDLDAAVKLAENYQPDSLGIYAITDWIEPEDSQTSENLSIPDFNGAGVTSSLTVEKPIAYVTCSADETEHHCVAEDTTIENSDPGALNQPLEQADVNIEAVQLRIKVTHPRFSDLGIRLKSPNGTESTVNAIFNNALVHPVSEEDVWIFLSYAFYGESPLGNWELSVVDALEGESGAVVDWSMRFFVGQHPH